MLNVLLPILLFLSSVFLILLVLIQRGRGGGLAGAFGGLGGQSAFGTKAGDLFTRITIGVAAFWIILCAASVKLLNDSGTNILSQDLGGAAKSATEELGTAPTGGAADAATKEAAPASEEKSAKTPAEPDSTPATDTPAAKSAPAETSAPAADTPEKSE